MRMTRRGIIASAGATPLAANAQTLPARTPALGNDSFPMFSDEEMAARLARVQKEMAARNLDALVFYGGVAIGNSQGQMNLQYLARYAACIESFMVVPGVGAPTLFLAVPFHVPNALSIAYVQDIRPGDCVRNTIARVKELKAERGRIGLVGPGASSGAGLTMFAEQRDALYEGLPDVRWENATSWFDDLRLIKSPEELQVLRRAGVITDATHEALFRATRRGVTKRALRRKIETIAAENGATFPFGHVGAISMRDPTGYYPDYYPTDEPIAPGSLVMTEICMGYGNYWGKIWGSYFVGEPPPEYRRLFETAAQVHDNLVREIKPGMTGRDIDAFLEPISKAGFEQPANILVGGWSAMNHAPQMGAMPGSMSVRRTVPYADKPLLPDQTVTLHAWVRIPGTQKGLWVGSSGAITQTGFEHFNRYPVSRLRVI